jgi:hypothetical protein
MPTELCGTLKISTTNNSHVQKTFIKVYIHLLSYEKIKSGIYDLQFKWCRIYRAE